MLNPDDIEETIQAATRQHAEDMDVLRRALEISRRVRRDGDDLPKPSTPEQPSVASQRIATPNLGRKEGFSVAVRKTYAAFVGHYSIRSIVDRMKVTHPAIIGNTPNHMVAISGVLLRDNEAGMIELVEKGTAGNPSIYRNKAMQPSQQNFSANGQRHRLLDLPVTNGTEKGAET